MKAQTDALSLFPMYGLSPYLQYYIKNNKGINNPYHNFNHTLNVLHYVIEGFRSNSNKYYSDIKSLLLGTLFHDFNHSGGKLTDEENIKLAIQGLKDAYKEIEKDKTKYNLVRKSDLKKAINYIKATQYPYVIDDEDLNEAQALIRDADIMSYISDDWLTQTLFGLSKEFGTDDYLAMINGIEEFLKNSKDKMRTPYAKTKFPILFHHFETDLKVARNNLK